MRFTEFKYKDNEEHPQTIRLKPLSVKHLADAWDVLKDLQKLEGTNSVPDKATVQKLIDLCTVTLKRSTPWDEEAIDEFIVEHFTELFPVVIEINFKVKQKPNEQH